MTRMTQGTLNPQRASLMYKEGMRTRGFKACILLAGSVKQTTNWPTNTR
jgi:hypothetical protein